MQIVRSAKNSDNVPVVVQLLVDDSQTINVGDLLQISSSARKLEVAVAASTTIVGIANQAITTTTATSADVCSVTLVKGEVVRAAVSQAGSKKTFAQTDAYTTAYDLLNKTTVAPDDTTGGMCYVQAWDNTAHTVDIIFKDANLASVG